MPVDNRALNRTVYGDEIIRHVGVLEFVNDLNDAVHLHYVDQFCYENAAPSLKAEVLSVHYPLLPLGTDRDLRKLDA